MEEHQTRVKHIEKIIFHSLQECLPDVLQPSPLHRRDDELSATSKPVNDAATSMSAPSSASEIRRRPRSAPKTGRPLSYGVRAAMPSGKPKKMANFVPKGQTRRSTTSRRARREDSHERRDCFGCAPTPYRALRRGAPWPPAQGAGACPATIQSERTLATPTGRASDSPRETLAQALGACRRGSLEAWAARAQPLRYAERRAPVGWASAIHTFPQARRTQAWRGVCVRLPRLAALVWLLEKPPRALEAM